MRKFLSLLLTTTMLVTTSISSHASSIILNRSVTNIKLAQNAMFAGGLRNVGLATSVSSNALTISLTQANGSSAPTAANPVDIGFRNSTLTTGGFSMVSATGSTTVTVSSGSTLGTVSGLAAYLYVYAINNSGTVELAVTNNQDLLDEGKRYSTTAEGGAGAADSYGVLYSTTARSNVAVRLLGRIIITQATAGTWASNATELALVPFKPLEAGLIGSLTYAGTANCQWVNSNTSYTVFPADTDCPTPTVTGIVTAPATKIPGFVLTGPPGCYKVEAYGAFYVSTTLDFGYQFFDGTTAFGLNRGSNQNSAVNAASLGSLHGTICYTNNAPNGITIQIRAYVASVSASIQNTTSNMNLQFFVYYQPTISWP